MKWSFVVIAIVVALCVVCECAPTEQVSALCAARQRRREREGREGREREALEEVGLVQYQEYLYEHEHITYSYDECFRMVNALEGFCKVNAHSSLDDEKEFMYACSAFVAPIVHNSTTLDRQCDFFFDVVTYLYCPLDPCVQITFEANNAHLAICNLLAVHNVSAPPTPQPVTAHAPLTCGTYSDVVMDSCLRARNSSFEALCGSFEPKYEREGCEEFVTRLADLFAPSAICDNYHCNNTHTPPMCDLLEMAVNETIPLEAFHEFQLATNHTYVVQTHHVGIRFLNATFGRGAGDKCNHLINNILKAANDSCFEKLECDMPNPQKANLTTKEPDGKKCKTEFEFRYVCLNNENATVHDVFGGEDVPVKTIKLSCTSDLPHYAINSGSRELLPTTPGGYGTLYDVSIDHRKPHVHKRSNHTHPAVQSHTLDAHLPQ